MVSAEQRWNEGQRAYARAATAFFNATRARNLAMLRLKEYPNNARARANLKRTEANRNRIWANYEAATQQTSNAYNELLRKYHIPAPRPRFQNAIMRNVVRNKKARVRQNARARELSKFLPRNMVNKVIRSLE